MTLRQLLVSTTLLLTGCLGGRDELPVGSGCVATSACTEGLICLFARCRQECTLHRDCGDGMICFAVDSELRMCTVPEDARACEAGQPACPDEVDCDETECWETCAASEDCTGEGDVCVEGRCWPPDGDDAGIPDDGMGDADVTDVAILGDAETDADNVDSLLTETEHRGLSVLGESAKEPSLVWTGDFSASLGSQGSRGGRRR